MNYYAHKNDNGEYQLLKGHLTNCAKLAGEYAKKFNAYDFGYLCGLLHDVGKYSRRFQEKLEGIQNGCRHTSAGGVLSIEVFGNTFGKLLSYIITGHHTGLKDSGSEISNDDGTLYARLNETIDDFSEYKNEIKINEFSLKLPILVNKNDRGDVGFSIAFLVRMIFSTLVDSDFIDTEGFMSGEKPRGVYESIESMQKVFFEHLKEFDGREQNKLNSKRKQILKRCIECSERQQGLYSLTVPTGGGKTISSMAFALNHAKKHNLDRIIYVIPYTSIIEQNAEVFKKNISCECILEHHSNFLIEDERTKLAAENWDIPIVVTTNVQFFESLFSNRSSKCRKLHNISKSVIVFDEVQMLPTDYLKCSVKLICQLVKNYNVSAVLCTATQPPLDMFIDNDMKITELIEDINQLYNDFKKVNIINIGDFSNDMLIEELNRHNQVLCIVNTKKYAKKIYDSLEGTKFHLSTNMCGLHRKETLRDIKKKLRENKQCKVVSTQLIEAGVDIDFPIVFRAMAGLDSIIQSAGRCNREGKQAVGYVKVFNPTCDIAKISGYMQRCAKLSQEIFRNFDDVLSNEAVTKYFRLLYTTEGNENLDKKDILRCFDTPLDFQFETAANRFNIIENNTKAVVIPYDDIAVQVINRARYSGFPMSDMRKLQPYTVNLYHYQFESLHRSGALELVNNAFWIINDMKIYYSSETGIIIPEEQEGEAIFG